MTVGQIEIIPLNESVELEDVLFPINVIIYIRETTYPSSRANEAPSPNLTHFNMLLPPSYISYPAINTFLVKRNSFAMRTFREDLTDGSDEDQEDVSASELIGAILSYLQFRKAR
jgi:hypothetical protein